MKILHVFLLLLVSFVLKGQSGKFLKPEQSNKIDSLFAALKSANHDSTKIQINLSIGDVLLDSSPDSAIVFYTNALSILNAYSFNNDESSPLRSTMLSLKAKVLRNIANANDSKGNFNLAITYCKQSLAISEELNDKMNIAACHKNIGIYYDELSNYNEALDHYLKALKIYEEISFKKGIAACLNNIGNINQYQGNFKGALDYYLKALNIVEELKDKSRIAICNGNIGMIYFDLHKYDSAIEYYNKSLKAREELVDKKGMAICFNNIGIVHVYEGNFQHAIKFFHKALSLEEEITDKEGISISYGHLADAYNNLKEYDKAIIFGKKGLTVAKEIGALRWEKNANTYLSDSYEGLSDFKQALFHYKQFRLLNDSIFNIEKYKQVAKMEAVYQNEKKQKEIELLNKDKEEQAAISAAESRKQKAIIHSIVVILLLVLVFAFLSTRSYLQKRSANILLAQQKVEIEEKNEELNQQNEEIAAQRDTLGQLNEEVTAQRDDLFVQRKIAIEQRDEITRQKKNITDSIAYAKHIQTAMLPNQNEINQVLPDNFVFFKPLDIVSGDFYWVNNVNGKSIIAVADCTGHGVPGAFMSVMGLNFLNSIVVEQGVTDPGDVLNQLNSLVINALSHEDAHFQDKDGMDISICCIDWSKMNVSYSCARNKIIVCRGNEILQSDANRFSIGKSPFAEKIEFVTGSFAVQKGDMIYLMTDGFVDQFGGPQRIKFLTSRFKKLALEIAHLETNKQKSILEKTIDEWQSNYHQIDDMLIVGFRV